MKELNIPKKIKVGGWEYKVHYPHEFVSESELDGLTTHSNHSIYLAKGEETEQTLWHEILHCVDKVYNNNSLSEEAITRMSEGLYQVFKDNFEFVF